MKLLLPQNQSFQISSHRLFQRTSLWILVFLLVFIFRVCIFLDDLENCLSNSHSNNMGILQNLKKCQTIVCSHGNLLRCHCELRSRIVQVLFYSCILNRLFNRSNSIYKLYSKEISLNNENKGILQAKCQYHFHFLDFN